MRNDRRCTRSRCGGSGFRFRGCGRSGGSGRNLWSRRRRRISRRRFVHAVLEDGSQRMRGASVPVVKPLEQLVVGGRSVGEGIPGVLIRREILPTHEILIVLSDLPTVENRCNRGRWRLVWSDVEVNRSGSRMKWGRIVIGFKKRDMENRMEMRKVRREREFAS